MRTATDWRSVARSTRTSKLNQHTASSKGIKESNGHTAGEKLSAAIKQVLEDKTLTLVRPTRRMLKVFPFIPHTLELTMPQGSVVAGIEEDEMMNVIKKVTNDAELEGAVRTFSRRGVRLHHPIFRCRSICPKSALRGRMTDQLMHPLHRASSESGSDLICAHTCTHRV